MRIAAVNRYGTIVGGVEHYLAVSLPAFQEAGHEVKLWCEELPGTAGGHSRIDCPIDLFGGDALDATSRGLKSLAAWKPDVICVHGLRDAWLARQIFPIAPAIFFAHAFAGMCISGLKTLHLPHPRPCDRTLGPGCFLHYYPHRCGGLSPVTMVRDYSRNRGHQRILPDYVAVVAFSTYMQAECVRHGADSARVRLIPPFSPRASRYAEGVFRNDGRFEGPALTADRDRVPVHIGYIGRIEPHKGVDILIGALPMIARRLDSSVLLTIAGEGRERASLESFARETSQLHPGIRIQFRNWIDDLALDEFYRGLTVLAVPSTWPEPFALVGLEAADAGVPVAAFAVGGIPDWLRDGVNGHLANATRPSSDSLADAVVRCLENPSHYANLRRGALAVSHEFCSKRHMEKLEDLLSEVAGTESALV